MLLGSLSVWLPASNLLRTVGHPSTPAASRPPDPAERSRDSAWFPTFKLMSHRRDAVDVAVSRRRRSIIVSIVRLPDISLWVARQPSRGAVGEFRSSEHVEEDEDASCVCCFAGTVRYAEVSVDIDVTRATSDNGTGGKWEVDRVSYIGAGFTSINW